MSGVGGSLAAGLAITGLLVAGCGSRGATNGGVGDDGEAVELAPAGEGVPPAGEPQVGEPAAEEPQAGKQQADEPADSGVVSDEQLAPIPSMPISQLLGRKRRQIETLFHPAEPGQAEGWVRYSKHLEVRYDRGRCVELVQLVPGGKTCREAARWVGFGAAMAPIYRAKSCVWPPKSLKHLLGEGVSGELILEGGVFRAQLDD